MNRCSRALALIALVAPFLVAPAAAATPAPGAPPPPACADAAFHTMDYWIGTWVVKDQSRTKTLGHSQVDRIAGGCGILEHWIGSKGATGNSISFFDPAGNRWVQHWLGSIGGYTDYAGAAHGTSVVFLARATMKGKPTIFRMTFSPLNDGRVRQFFESSTDNGTTWTPGFDGYYERDSGTTPR